MSATPSSNGVFFALGIACFLLGLEVVAGEGGYLHVPETVSAAAQRSLSRSGDPHTEPASPDADDIDAWRRVQAANEEDMRSKQEPFAEQFGAREERREIAGVICLEVTPAEWGSGSETIIYLHGGAYVNFSAFSTVGVAALLADLTGMRVISIDYTRAPQAQWRQVTDEVVSVYRSLLADGEIDAGAVAFLGDSAGGGLAAGTVLKLRDLGLPLPAALVLWSPWSDITDAGDTYTTLAHAEPAYVYGMHLQAAASAYADPEDQRHPYVSPVYGDYAAGFPPTLIQGGTKEIFLSNFVRHYQAIDQAGQVAKLDIYEGMPHVFQVTLLGTPESEIALQKSRAFLHAHMAGDQ